MDNSKLPETQGYFDLESGEPLQLWLGVHTLDVDGIQIKLRGVPLLRNESSGEIYLPNKTKRLIADVVQEARKRGRKSVGLSPKNRGDIRFPFAEKLAFLYSHIDYEYIPGLVRPSDKGFLTPVFFNITVLNKYSQHPEYKLDLFSETYGSISRGDEWYIAFGINKNKKLIMWLGDIDELPDDEKHYLRSENIQSDHEIHSEFYNAQIEVQFSEPSPQNALFRIRKDLNDLVGTKFGFDLFVLDGEVSEVIQNLDRPVFWEDKHVGPVIESFNRIFVESINIKELKKDIAAVNAAADVESKRELKTFEIWIDKRLKAADSSGLMCPFFVLYDFRVITCHLKPAEKKEETLRFINQRLGLPEGNQDYEQIYDILIAKLAGSISKVIELIKC